MPSIEKQRLADDRDSGRRRWRKWGPYVSYRQWGTVREDYSADGSAWEYLPHDHARSRAYRWGEDAIAGICDEKQHLCFGVAMWNERDPILKERFFGLTNPQGNHGEDVKELYYHLDATPTHSYLKTLYKYPQAEFPYAKLIEENARRGREQPEYEIIDTGVFDDDRYFDVFVEYAKADPEDILIRITVHNRAAEAATIHILPQLWFRNRWSWDADSVKPSISPGIGDSLELESKRLGRYFAYFDGAPEFLFCDNETNERRLFNVDRGSAHPKDAINDRVVRGDKNAVSSSELGTKSAAWYRLNIAPGKSVQIRARLTNEKIAGPFAKFDATFATRIAEADAFYAEVQQDLASDDAKLVQRQALAGMIWNKQFYRYNVERWLDGDPTEPAPDPRRKHGRNSDWQHLNNDDVISMPDKWEFPWYASWDLAFHAVALAMIDPTFAKEQILLLTREWYMHPNGQLPAYEWAMGDVNPPVQAWAAMRVFEMDRTANDGKGDLAFLEKIYHKLLLNFTWWVNRKDVQGHNIFQGGFLGLDNIGVFDRNAALPGGARIDQTDATSWMGMFCLNLMRIALELSLNNPVYQDLATKFFEHFLYIAAAMRNIGDESIDLWDEEDQFYYDVLCFTDNTPAIPLKCRSLVGLTPLFAVEVLEPELLQRVPEFTERLEWFLDNHTDMASLVSRWREPGRGDTRLLSLLRGHRMKRLLKRMLDETEFLSPYGIRSMSRSYLENPYVLDFCSHHFEVHYEPGESSTDVFGGNSNWRGPVWMPINYLLIESVRRFHQYYGDDFKIECPTSSGNMLTLRQSAEEVQRRLTTIFLRDAKGNRAVFNHRPTFQTNPAFRDHILFHEYFHGDSGAGLGASHQTGWTGLIALLLAGKR